MNFRRVRGFRIASQILFLFLFLVLFYWPHDPSSPGSLAKPFLLIDPLHYLISIITTHQLISLMALSLIPLILTLIFGRFFCGWICPMGSLQHFFSNLTGRFRKEKHSKTGRSLLSIKYLLLIPVILISLLGLNLAGWLDPISLLTRSLAGLHDPLILLILTGIILLNIGQHRFFCRVLCPLGAIFGLVARFCLLKWVPGQSCAGCRHCLNACAVSPDLPHESLSSECLLCMNCARSCSGQILQLKFRHKEITTEQEYLPKRRVVLTTLFASAAWALLPKLSAAKSLSNRSAMVRPPGSLPEKDFLDRCARCGQCMQSCPTGFIQPAGIEHGLETLWTPVCTGESGGCSWECLNCSNVCPGGAIRRLSLREKQSAKIGTAIINKNLCYTYADGFNCTACQEVCPVPGKAIRFRQAEIVNFRGYRVTINQIYILNEYCTGCGLCVKACPRSDRSAIQITPENEDRRNPGL
ncbi:MAG: 4Fe-4S dicluster domain-containing protein [Bacteroidia bacterium]|nr:4Fe-4S dicluster domain-containing protein [Bacteroidia bacterium]